MTKPVIGPKTGKTSTVIPDSAAPAKAVTAAQKALRAPPTLDEGKPAKPAKPDKPAKPTKPAKPETNTAKPSVSNRYADDAVVTIVKNDRRPGSLAHEQFEIYKRCKTMGKIRKEDNFDPGYISSNLARGNITIA